MVHLAKLFTQSLYLLKGCPLSVLVALSSLSNDGQNVSTDVSALAFRTGYSKRQIHDALNLLHERGLVVCPPGTRGALKRAVLFPRVHQAADLPLLARDTIDCWG